MLQFRMSLIVIFATVILVFYPTQEVWACSCRGSSVIIQEYINSDIVFIGTITKIESSTRVISEIAEFKTSLATFEINSKWKGDLNDTIKIESYSGGGSCGFGFRNNTSYLILTHSNANDYPFENSCGADIRLTENIGLSFIKIVLKFIFDPFVLISLLIIIPTSIIIVVIKKKNHGDLKWN